MTFPLLEYLFFGFVILTFLYDANLESGYVISCTTKSVKYWMKNISENIGAVFFKLGTRNAHHKRNKMTPVVAFQKFSRGLKSFFQNVGFGASSDVHASVSRVTISWFGQTMGCSNSIITFFPLFKVPLVFIVFFLGSFRLLWANFPSLDCTFPAAVRAYFSLIYDKTTFFCPWIFAFFLCPGILSRVSTFFKKRGGFWPFLAWPRVHLTRENRLM